MSPKIMLARANKTYRPHAHLLDIPNTLIYIIYYIIIIIIINIVLNIGVWHKLPTGELKTQEQRVWTPL